MASVTHSAPDPSIFHRYLLNRYPALQAQHPALNRRALLLLIADEFWSLDAQSWTALSALTTPGPSTSIPHIITGTSTIPTDTKQPPPSSSDTTEAKRASAVVGFPAKVDADADEDEDGDNTAPPGIVLRTDYSTGSDDAWAGFCRALHDAEREFFADQAVSPPVGASEDANMDVDENVDEDEDESEDEEAPTPHPGGASRAESSDAEGDGDVELEAQVKDNDRQPVLFSFISDPTQFNDISNLRALRLLFDVSVRLAPLPSSTTPSTHSHSYSHSRVHVHGTGTARQHQHRLTCLRGLQETYDARGRTLWIFDSRSRADACTRLVSEAGDVATGDSWRARATHMAELQASLAARALRIDFGGLDRWDYTERQRNMREADTGSAVILSEMK